MKAVTYGREWVLRELIDNVERAKAAEDFGAANTALRLLGVERQMFVERKEQGAPGDFASAASAADVLALVKAELGDETALLLAAALAKGNPSPAEVVAPRGEGEALN